jgi:cellulose synthase/poly-beta-1,6-N-acetylglucosamine synthase-like glycosyltransferase
VSVTEFPSRRGKASVLNDLVAASSADVLVFTDANTAFEPGAIAALCRALAPERVGAACGTLVLRAVDAAGLPEEEFWDRETRLKELEGSLGLCLGANGAIYAAKRAAVTPLRADTTSMDDFLIPLGILRRGGEVVFVREAVAFEPAGRTARAESSRRFRIGVGAGQVLRRERWLWNVPGHPLLSMIFFSRKAARWLAPVVFLAAIAAALASSELRLPAGVALAVFLLVLGLARRPYYFAVINLSLAAGVVAGLLGYSRPAWKSHR